MPNSIKNIIVGTIGLILLIAAFFLALFLFKSGTKNFPHAHSGGCCCCGGGGMNSASGNMNGLGGSRSGNPTTTVMTSPGVIGQPDTIKIHIDPNLNPGVPTIITITFTCNYPAHLLLTGTGVTGPTNLTPRQAPYTYTYTNGIDPVDWRITFASPPPNLSSSITYFSGDGTSSYSATYSFTAPNGSATSAGVTVNAN